MGESVKRETENVKGKYSALHPSNLLIHRGWEKKTALTLTLSPGRGNAEESFAEPARCSAIAAMAHADVVLEWSNLVFALPLLGGEGRGEGGLCFMIRDKKTALRPSLPSLRSTRRAVHAGLNFISKSIAAPMVFSVSASLLKSSIVFSI